MGGAGAKESSMPSTETLLTYEKTLAKAREEAVVGRDGTGAWCGHRVGLGLPARGVSECELSCFASREEGYQEAEKFSWCGAGSLKRHLASSSGKGKLSKCGLL